MKKILVVGSVNMDLVTSFDVLPKKGETSFGNGFLKNPGGKGANQACAASLLGADVTMIASVGEDEFGKELENTVKGCNVQTKWKKDHSKTTGVATILLDETEHDNRIIVIPGANYSLTKEDIDKNLSLIKEADILLLQLEIPLQTVEYVASLGKKLGKTVILNPAPGKKLPDSLLRNVTYLTPNETELSLVSGIDIDDEASFYQACSFLRDKGVDTLLITLGEKGVFVFNDERKELVPAYKVQPIDTTAAGDCFNGAFARSLAKGYPLLDAIAYAQKASSISIQRKGAIRSLPKEEEVLL